MKNVGLIDKVIRSIVGIAIIGAGVYFKNWWGAVGLLPLATVLLGWCPAYSLFGINSCPMKKD